MQAPSGLLLLHAFYMFITNCNPGPHFVIILIKYSATQVVRLQQWSTGLLMTGVDFRGLLLIILFFLLTLITEKNMFGLQQMTARLEAELFWVMRCLESIS